MATHPADDPVVVREALRAAIAAAIPEAHIAISGASGHYAIAVSAPSFAGKGLLESQRLVYRAIAHLMAGAAAPVHAIDSLKTRAAEVE